jgi:hypothetical protein
MRTTTAADEETLVFISTAVCLDADSEVKREMRIWAATAGDPLEIDRSCRRESFYTKRHKYLRIFYWVYGSNMRVSKGLAAAIPPR